VCFKFLGAGTGMHCVLRPDVSEGFGRFRERAMAGQVLIGVVGADGLRSRKVMTLYPYSLHRNVREPIDVFSGPAGVSWCLNSGSCQS